MTDEDIFHLAEKNGYLDDFGRWNFTDDGLLDFVFEIQKAEREACAKVCEEDESGRDSGGYYADIIRAME